MHLDELKAEAAQETVLLLEVLREVLYAEAKPDSITKICDKLSIAADRDEWNLFDIQNIYRDLDFEEDMNYDQLSETSMIRYQQRVRLIMTMTEDHGESTAQNAREFAASLTEALDQYKFESTARIRSSYSVIRYFSALAANHVLQKHGGNIWEIDLEGADDIERDEVIDYVKAHVVDVIHRIIGE